MTDKFAKSTVSIARYSEKTKLLGSNKINNRINNGIFRMIRVYTYTKSLDTENTNYSYHNKNIKIVIKNFIRLCVYIFLEYI